MADQYSGWLPYGSGDSSIIWSDPLTNETNLVANGGVEQGTAASQFDSVRGMKPLGPTGDLTDFPDGNGSYGYLLTAITNYTNLIEEGQLTFEVEKKALAVLDAANGSNGYDTTARTSEPAFLCFRDSANEYMGFKLARSAAAKRSIFQRATTNTAGIVYHDSYPGGTEGNYVNESAYPDDYVTVNLAWRRTGTNYYLYTSIGGSLRERTLTSSGSFSATTMFNRIYIGSLIASPQFVAPYWIRNLQISSRFPSLGARASIGRTILVSDSLFLDSTEDGTYKDAVTIGSYRRQMATRVPRTNKTSALTNSGYKMQISGGNDFSDVTSNVTLLFPKTVVILFGTNDYAVADPGAVVTATVIADYKTNLDTLYSAGVENIIVCTIPTLKHNSTYNTAAHVSAVADFNTGIDTLPAYVATNHPTKTCFVCDLYTAFGGELGDVSQWIGGFTGAEDNLHWHALGHYKAGKVIADIVIENLLL